MELIERAGLLGSLCNEFEKMRTTEGRCIFLCGEAGIGKTALVKAFTQQVQDRYGIFLGTCDALFSPRPLAPLYDILLQMHDSIPENISDRSAFFTRIFLDIKNNHAHSVIIFEDVHWADEATLDFIKFFSRRISQLKCLFIITYRDNEINAGHPLRNVLGQLSAGTFTRYILQPLSREAVEKMSFNKGYNGEDVYSISGGNPFYVNEILAHYSPGIPDNIKDSILSVYDRQDEKTKQLWQILSVLPKGIEATYLDRFGPEYISCLEKSLEADIAVMRGGSITFKHELYRRTIEEAISPLIRVVLNKKILELFHEDFEKNNQIEQIVHHAKNANQYTIVTQYAPLAAKRAAELGAHIEAAKFYNTSIEYYQGSDKDFLLPVYEAYAYECYLTNQIRTAIVYQTKALNLWKEKNNIVRAGNALRFLSRLWWFEGKGKQAESFAIQAIDALHDQPFSKEKAMAFSNMSQLKMLSNKKEECMYWGGKAVDIAKEINDQEIISHALNNMGAVQMIHGASYEKGKQILLESLDIALKHSFHEHAARAYTNLGCYTQDAKDYAFAKAMFDAGITYCEEQNLDSWTAYMNSRKASLLTDLGCWKEARELAANILKYENTATIVRFGALAADAWIKMRTGDADPLPSLNELKTKAFETQEISRIIPALCASCEYEWITGNIYLSDDELNKACEMIMASGDVFEIDDLDFWLYRARGRRLAENVTEKYDLESADASLKAAAFWEKAGNPYLQSLALFAGDEDYKRKALQIIQSLGANAICEKMKQLMRTEGIRKIPRGIRKSTQSNPALLTDRELDVLRLLHEGKSNKQIASELFISAKTVDHHISSILFKLEADSRARAVQEAMKLGILK